MRFKKSLYCYLIIHFTYANLSSSNFAPSNDLQHDLFVNLLPSISDTYFGLMKRFNLTLKISKTFRKVSIHFFTSTLSRISLVPYQLIFHSNKPRHFKRTQKTLHFQNTKLVLVPLPPNTRKTEWASHKICLA